MERERQELEAFLMAARCGDMDDLLALLATDVVLRSPLEGRTVLLLRATMEHDVIPDIEAIGDPSRLASTGVVVPDP